MSRKNRLVDVQLDANSLAVANPDVEHERRVAIFDLLEDNEFEIIDGEEGPYILNLSVQEQRLVFDVKHENGTDIKIFILSLSPLRRIIRDYLMICESYHHAIRNSTPSQIEAVDMGRRGLHNEGSEILEMRLKDKIKFNFDTARRLFTLVCALHIRL
ncbi:MAG: UPF0262 family protein [Caulobacterales bacterium]|nr:UPF0262 family protein [Caulobacterales bacterium]MCA0373828.1 UPF0262 family protein [Pseudomonadota bacterium]